MATQEMQRYTFRAPGQATSYFYGYQRIMETRQAAQLAGLRSDEIVGQVLRDDLTIETSAPAR